MSSKYVLVSQDGFLIGMSNDKEELIDRAKIYTVNSYKKFYIYKLCVEIGSHREIDVQEVDNA